MQFIISCLIGLVFVFNFTTQSFAVDKNSKDEPKRNVAQTFSTTTGEYKGKCIPLEVKNLQLFNEHDEYIYTKEEMRMLRNSIYAQYGYPFKDQIIKAEMEKRGCKKSLSNLSYKKISHLDIKNIRLIKSYEEYLKSDLRRNKFDEQWNTEDKEGRIDMVKGHYCYLIQKNENSLKGVINFNSKKQKDGHYKLDTMMSPDNPKWAVNPGPEEEKEYKNKLNKRELDMTDLGSLFDYEASGSWFVGDDKNVRVTIGQIKLNDQIIEISGELYKEKEILVCKY